MADNHFTVRGFISGEFTEVVQLVDGFLATKKCKKIVDENTVYYQSVFPRISLMKRCDADVQIIIGEDRVYNSPSIIGNLVQMLQNYFNECSSSIFIHDLFLDYAFGDNITDEYILNLLRLSYVWYRYLAVFTSSDMNSYSISQLPDSIRKMIFLGKEYNGFVDFSCAYLMSVNTPMIDVTEVIVGKAAVTAYLGSNLTLIEHLIYLYTRLFDYAAVKRTHSSPTNKDNLLSTYTLKAKALFKGYDVRSRKVLGKVLKDYVAAQEIATVGVD